MFATFTSASKQTIVNLTTLKAKNQATRLVVLFCLLVAALPVSALTYQTTGALNAAGVPFSWSSPKAWKVLGQSTVGREPNSGDDVIIIHSITIPQSAAAYCKSLTVAGGGSPITLTIGSGAILEVDSDVNVQSPNSGTNLINMPQGILLISGNLLMGEKVNNGGQLLGTASIFVAGPAGSSGFLKVRGNISPGTKSGATYTDYTIEILNTAVVELGGSLAVNPNATLIFSAPSTIKFDGVKPQSLPTGVNFGNVQVANPVGLFLSGPVNTTNLLGDLTVLSGRLENNGFAIAGRVAKEIIVKNGAKLVLSGSSSFPTGFGTVTLEPASTVTYDGLATQYVAARAYGNLELLGSVPGTHYQKFLSTGTTTANNVLVEADLMLDYSSLDLGNGILTLKPEGAIQNYNGTHYIKLNTAGKMVVENMGQTLGARSTEVIYPIGTATNFTPAYLTNLGSTNNFAIGVTDGVMNYATNTPITQYVVNKTWDVECLNQVGSPNVKLRLQWNQNDETPGFTKESCYVTHYLNNAWSKSDVFQDATLSARSASMENVTSFSPFSVAGSSNPLPVELVFLKAVKKESQVLVTWETASEKNCLGYEILASADGANFETVGQVASQNGNANYTQRYEFLDKTNRTGLVYYRLKQTDLDGTIAYYATQVVDMGKFAEAFTAFPNPFQSRFELKLKTATTQEIQLLITDLTGKTVYRQAQKVTAGETNIPVTLNAALPAGTYILSAKTADQLYTTRLLKQ